MAKKPLPSPLPADLPENWALNQVVSPNGTEAGLDEKHGYNYQGKQINAAQKGINALNEGMGTKADVDPVTNKVVAEQMPPYQGPLKDATTKDTPVDNDSLALVDSADANKTKRVLWSRIKAVLKGWFDTLYAAINHTHDPVSVGGIPIVTTYTPAGGVDGVDYAADVPGVGELYKGLTIIADVHVTSTDYDPLLNVNSLGGKRIRRYLSTNTLGTAAQLPTNVSWLRSGRAVQLMYNGTYWVVMGLTKPSASDLSGTVAVVNGGTGATTAAAARTNLDVYSKSEVLAASGVTSGTATALTLAQAGFTLFDGALVRFRLHTASGSQATLNVNGTGAKSLKANTGKNMPANIPAGMWLTAVYSSYNDFFVLQSSEGGMQLRYGNEIGQLSDPQAFRGETFLKQFGGWY